MSLICSWIESMRFYKAWCRKYLLSFLTATTAHRHFLLFKEILLAFILCCCVLCSPYPELISCCCFVLISLFHCDEKLLGPLHLETVISSVLKYVLCWWFFSLLLPFSFFMVRHQPFVIVTSRVSSLIFLLFPAIFHLCLYSLLGKKIHLLSLSTSVMCFFCLFLLSYLSFKNSFLCFEFL